jgi:hypothetical protein
MDKNIFDLSLRVLVYEEDRQCRARCLEMDLVGSGKNEREALRQLEGLVQDQISFALFKNDHSLIMFPSDETYINRWEEAQQFRLHNELFPDTAVKLKAKAVFIMISKEELAELKKRHRFNTISASALAQTKKS